MIGLDQWLVTRKGSCPGIAIKLLAEGSPHTPAMKTKDLGNLDAMNGGPNRGIDVFHRAWYPMVPVSSATNKE